jgi:hypothetical protein
VFLKLRGEEARQRHGAMRSLRLRCAEIKAAAHVAKRSSYVDSSPGEIHVAHT